MMSKVKDWLLEMESYAFECLDNKKYYDALTSFLDKYPGQRVVFDHVYEFVLKEYNEECSKEMF